MVQILGRNLPEETAGGVGLMLAVPHAGLRIRERNRPLGTREGYIKEPALFFQFLRRHHPSGRGEEILLHTGHENIGELQSLGGVNRHQGHLVVGFVVGHIDIGEEGHVLQIIGQDHLRRLFIGIRIGLLYVFHISLDGVQQFLNVAEPALPFHGVVGLIEKVEPAFGGQRTGHIEGISLQGFPGSLFHQGTERPDFADGRVLQAETLQLRVRQRSRLEKGQPGGCSPFEERLFI